MREIIHSNSRGERSGGCDHKKNSLKFWVSVLSKFDGEENCEIHKNFRLKGVVLGVGDRNLKLVFPRNYDNGIDFRHRLTGSKFVECSD